MNQVQQIRDALAKGNKYYIFSVFPIGMKADRPFNGSSTYILPAAKTQSDVTRCEVSNAFQYTHIANGVWESVPIFADSIAQDVLNEFSGGMLGQDSGNGPGIWMQDSPEPDPEQVDANRVKQTAFFEFLVNQADGLHKSGKGNEITDLHRAAARWLGYETFAWLEKMTQKALKECVACFSRIDGRATICPVCTTRQPSDNPTNPAGKSTKKEVAELTKS